MSKIIKPSELIGKTISNVTFMRHEKYDDEGWLKLDFTDGVECVIEAEYLGYTGDSIDEYPTSIEILAGRRNIVPNLG